MMVEMVAVLVVGLAIVNGVGLTRWWMAGLDRREGLSFGAVTGLAGLAWLELGCDANWQITLGDVGLDRDAFGMDIAIAVTSLFL